MQDWVIDAEKARMVFAPESFEIDLRTLTGRSDIKAVIKSLKQEPFATPQVVQQAQDMLTSYLVWLQAQERVKRVRTK